LFRLFDILSNIQHIFLTNFIRHILKIFVIIIIKENLVFLGIGGLVPGKNFSTELQKITLFNTVHFKYHYSFLDSEGSDEMYWFYNVFFSLINFSRRGSAPIVTYNTLKDM